VLTAESHHAVLALCPRNGLVEVRCGDGDVVHALAKVASDWLMADSGQLEAQVG
jgi:hypothetical protein